MSDPIRVLVVDDSAFMRRAIARMLEKDPAFQVVGQAGNGHQALKAVEGLAPDVVTMDVEMPVMDGLSALRQLMATRPLPVVMVSNLTQEGAQATLEALALGAVEVVPKPFGSMVDVLGAEDELRAKVRAAAQAKGLRPRPVAPTAGPVAAPTTVRGMAASPGEAAVAPPRPLPPAPPPPQRAPGTRPEAIAIGVSTGGPAALEAVFRELPADFPVGLVVVQHMPPGFTRPLAERLDGMCALTVREAAEDDAVLPGVALIAPAGKHLVLRRDGGLLRCHLIEDPTVATWHRPSVDVLFASVAQVVGPNALAVVLTGMGSDGTGGARALKDRGGEVWAQDEATCVVYGMPRKAWEAGVVDRVVPLDALPAALVEVARLSHPEAPRV